MTGDGFPHGEPRGYLRGCRCDDCRAANAAAEKRRRAVRAGGPAKQVPHGTPNGYCNYGCRCPDCRAANAALQRRYRQRLRSGWRAAS